MLTPQPFSIKVSKLLEEIQAAKAAGRYLNYIRTLIKTNVLILDAWD